MEVLRVLIGRMFENGDKFLECLLLTFGSLGQDSKEGLTWQIASLSPPQSQIKQLLTPTSSSNLYWCLIGQFLPSSALAMTVDRILEQSSENPALVFYDRSTCRLVSFLLRQLRDRVEVSINDKTTMSRHVVVMLAAWMGFDKSQLVDRVFADFVNELEDSLCWSLSQGYTSFALLSYDCVSLINRFIEIKIATHKWCTVPQRCLLTIVVLSDPTKFCEAFFKVYSAMKNNKEYRQIFASGILDTSMATILKNDDNKKYHRDEILSIIKDVNERLSALSTSVSDFNITSDQMNGLPSLTQRLIDVESESVPDMLNTSLLADILAQLLVQNDQETATPKQHFFTSTKAYMEVALNICVQCRPVSDSISSLSSILFLNFCDAIVLNLSYHKSRGSPTNPSTPSLMQLVAWMKQLISNNVTFDSNALKDNVFATSKVLFKACLRHGMRIESDGRHDIQLLCLQLVNSLIKFAHGARNPIGSLVTADTSPPNQSIPSLVFNMVTTHSQFEVLMSSVEDRGIQVELSRILCSCISNATDMKFDPATWTSLLACYNAGIDDKDLFFRSILFGYSQLAIEVRGMQK